MYYDGMIKNEIEQMCFRLACEAENKKIRNLCALLDAIKKEESKGQNGIEREAGTLRRKLINYLTAEELEDADEELPGLCEIVVDKYPQLLEYVPWEMQTQAMCDRAVEKLPDMVGFTAPEYLTNELCVNAVKQKWICIARVPVGMRTKEICEIAVRGDELASRFCP